MRNKKIEKKLLEAANKATPEPPPFEEIDKKMNWDSLAQDCKTTNRVKPIVPIVAIAASVLLVSVITIGALIHSFSSQYKTSPGGWFSDSHSFSATVGKYNPKQWQCSQTEWDLSLTSLCVSREQSSVGQGTVSLFGNDKKYICSISFSGAPFSRFQFSNIIEHEGKYVGSASYQEESKVLLLTFSIESINEKTIFSTFKNEDSSICGEIMYQFSE